MPAPAITFEIGTWDDYRNEVQAVNPTLTEIIDQISPNNDYKLIKARYLYGEKITDFGDLQVPDDHQHGIGLNDTNAPETLRALLCYAPAPLMLQLKNCAEVFVETEDRTIPMDIFYPGDLYSILEALSPVTQYRNMQAYCSISSGARSIFHAAKVDNTRGNNKLMKAFNFHPGSKRGLKEQWRNIKHIINHNESADTCWNSEVILFTKKWFERQDDNLHWTRFLLYLHEKMWSQSKSFRIGSELATFWATYSDFLAKRNYTPNVYIANTIKQALYIAHGAAPGFNVLSEPSSERAPYQKVEQAYQEIYGKLNGNAPALIGPARLKTDASHHQSVMYSINYPTCLDISMEMKNKSQSILSDLKTVSHYFKLLFNCFEQESVLKTLTNHADFGFYHPDTTYDYNIQDISKLTDCKVGIKTKMQNYPDLQFPFGPFFNGVICIGHHPGNAQANS